MAGWSVPWLKALRQQHCTVAGARELRDTNAERLEGRDENLAQAFG